MKGPPKLGKKAKKAKPGAIGKAIASAQKNSTVTIAVLAIVAITLYLIFATPRTEEQAKMEEFFVQTTTTLRKHAELSRKAVKPWVGSDELKASAELWETWTPWQRQSTIGDTHRFLAEEDLKKVLGTVMNAPDLGRMFQSSSPDLFGDEIVAEASGIWNLLDAWMADNHATEAVMGEDAFGTFEEVVGYGFWGNSEIFSKSDNLAFSLDGYTSARGAMLGRFWRRFRRDLKVKGDQVSAGVELNWPEEPVPEPSWSEEESGKDVVHMDHTTIDTDVKEKTHALVMFYAPWCGHCKAFKPDFGKAATLLKDHDVVIGGMDVIKHKKIKKKFDIKSFPTIYYFKNGEHSGDYDGGRDIFGVLEWLSDETRVGSVLESLVEEHRPEPEVQWADEENDVLHLTDDNFSSSLAEHEHSLVMFYAPWCGHCKAFKPGYAEAATALKGSGAVVAAVDATVHRKVAEEYEVKGYPTVFHFAGGEKQGKYEGARDAEGVISFLSNKVGKIEL